MSTPFQSALSAYVDAHLTYNKTWDADNEGAGEATVVATRALSQAGDALEGELRRMMREESAPASKPRLSHESATKLFRIPDVNF